MSLSYVNGFRTSGKYNSDCRESSSNTCDSEEIFPALGAIFSVILIAGIFTTTVSLLWISCNFLCQDEKNKKFKIIALVASVVVFFGSELPFSTLVNIVYPYTGYLGIVIFLCILYVHYIKKNKVNPETNEAVE